MFFISWFDEWFQLQHNDESPSLQATQQLDELLAAKSELQNKLQHVSDSFIVFES